VYPGLPVVIASGLMTDQLQRDAAQAGVRHLLQKENLFEELAPAVLRVLSERGVAAPKQEEGPAVRR